MATKLSSPSLLHQNENIRQQWQQQPSPFAMEKKKKMKKATAASPSSSCYNKKEGDVSKTTIAFFAPSK